VDTPSGVRPMSDLLPDAFGPDELFKIGDRDRRPAGD
jgi:hypothetical protein